MELKMSAYVVQDSVILGIVQFASKFNVHVDDMPVRGNEQDFVDLLVAENVISVNYRYKEKTEPHIVIYDEFETDPESDPDKVIRLCETLEYQSCEHPEWDDTVAYRTLLAVKSVALLRKISKGH
jgi:hypothetical protein